MTRADAIVSFLETLEAPKVQLPEGIRLINPYKENSPVMDIARSFYRKFYSDAQKRFLILGINPGRFGGAVTGIPFTDPKRLASDCGIRFPDKITHEPSSVFIYEMIAAYGGVEAFYKKFYINSLCPLALTITGEHGKEKNYNYYDRLDLQRSLEDFIVENIYKQKSIGVHEDVCFCFGTGKNEAVLRMLNEKYGFFRKIVALEHPRFIMQYKSKQKGAYISKYLTAFNDVGASVE